MRVTQTVPAVAAPEEATSPAVRAVVLRSPSLMRVSTEDAFLSSVTVSEIQYSVSGPVTVAWSDPSRTSQTRPVVSIDIYDRAPVDCGEWAQASYVFAKRLAAQPAVKALSVAREGDIVRLWTFIERRDKEVRRQIYAVELDLMDVYPALKFDFNVVSLDCVGEGEFLPADSRGQLVYYRS